jgi:hypothetical protein
MAEIRGEKVKFRKQDIIPLHDLPSAKAEEPLIVHCPPPRSVSRVCLKFVTGIFVVVFLFLGGVVAAIETGSVDGILSSQAEMALKRAIDPRYEARIGSTAIRFVKGFRLALEARDVDIVDTQGQKHLSRAAVIRMALNPMALLTGQISLESIDASSLSLDVASLPAGKPIDISTWRVDAIPEVLETAFGSLDGMLSNFERAGTDRISIDGISITIPKKDGGKPLLFDVRQMAMTRNPQGGYNLDGELAFNGELAAFSLSIESAGGKITAFEANLDGLDLNPLTIRRDPEGFMHEGADLKAGVRIIAKRQSPEVAPLLSVMLGVGNGSLYIGGEEQLVSTGRMTAQYDFEKREIEIAKSRLELERTVVPFEGSIKDTADDQAQQGFDLALSVTDGIAAAAMSGEAPVPFGLTANGQYLKATKELNVPSLYVAGPLGDMAGSLKIRFAEQGSPEISFGGQIPKMEATAVKQLWPFWMARKVRPWVVGNIFGGTVTNGSIAVFIPQGRMCGIGCPLELHDDEIQIQFDIENTRLNITGDIPPLRDAVAHFNLKGEKVDVTVAKATSYFPSNRSLAVESGRFTIPSTYAKPLMADLDLFVSGSADTIAEMANFKPINALKDTTFKPEDFRGNVKAQVNATFGLLSSQNPPHPAWAASLTLDNVSLAKPFANRQVADLNGALNIDNNVLRLQGNGKVDDVAMDINLIEPLRDSSKIAREFSLKAVIGNDQIAKFAPGLGSVVSGPITMQLDGKGETDQTIRLDLTKSSLTVPGIGWSKGPGVKADATFHMLSDQGRVSIRDFELKGDGFGAKGDLELAQGGLVSADFSHMKLSASDDYAVQIKAAKRDYVVTASGKSVDIRPLIARIRSSEKSGSDDGAGDIKINARFDRVIGFNNEALSNVTSNVFLRNGKLNSLQMDGVTDSRQAIVAQTSAGGGRQTINLTSSDAGAIIRFANIYTRINGGLLNIVFNTVNGDDWFGSVDMRNFSVSNEQKLQDIVATPVGQDGRSLNKAVRRDIDVSSEKFQRGFARVIYGGGALNVENGVVRGEQVGATFQGTLKDANGNMDMTGTFMPAYGLNRLFGELPFIGVILGNGRDRGLLGITFKLSGRSDTPRLTVNPLSLIAPGVFRQIFEFQ